jgi:hypothetical protein
MEFLDRIGFDSLLRSLVDAGYELIGPTVRDGAIVLDPIDGIGDLPAGIGEEQAPGTYRLTRRDDDRLFGWAHGPEAGKRYLFPPRERLATIRREDSMEVEPTAGEAKPFAFVGLRSCDLHAVAVQDRVFLELDPRYRRRREQAVFIGVNCEEPGSTCFCVSMGTGPRCTTGEMLGLDPLCVANEGVAVAIVAPEDAEDVLDVAGGQELGAHSALIGIVAEGAPRVGVKTGSVSPGP